MVLALVVMQIWPLGKQRDRAIDGAISNDIYTIRAAADTYARKKNKSPSSLSDLDLDKKLTSRSVSYGYSLERSGANKIRVCAVFKTDTRTDNNTIGTNPLDDLPKSSGSYSSSYYSGYDDPNVHGKGKECFTSQVYGLYNSRYPSTYNQSSPESPIYKGTGIDDTNSL